MDILTYFGITDCIAKSHGNRNIYNVVRATFKAIMTHESMEEVALKRGKRLLNIERAQRLQI
jgi:ribosomal protein S5